MDVSTYLNIRTVDVGSLPDPYPVSDYRANPDVFEKAVVEGFIGKLKAGIQVPTYPQYRDMNEMFLEMIDGVSKAKGGYTVLKPLEPREHVIPEVKILADSIGGIEDEIGGVPSIRICVTSPYTLSYSFTGISDKLWLWEALGDVLSEIAGETVKAAAVFSSVMVSLDEPVLGMVDDPLLDVGDEGVQVLAGVIDKILHRCKVAGAETCIHLHSTSGSVIWKLRNLDIVESHVEDPLYRSGELVERVTRSNLRVKAAVCRTNYDRLLESKLGEYGLTVDVAWRKIKDGSLDPALFLEDVRLMSERLKKIVRAYGGRVKYAGPECGLRSFPSYGVALKYLSMVSQAVKLVIKP